MSTELEYVQEKTDWARVVETPDSARIVPPDRPPQVHFVDGPIGKRIGGWVFVGLLALGVGFIANQARLKLPRVRMPVDWVDYASFGVGLLMVLVFLALLGSMVWALVVAALPQKCEILVHVSGIVVRLFRGAWQKTEIGRGGVRTVLLSTLRSRQGTRSGSEPLVHVTLVCQGKRELVQIGLYEAALARDIAQAIVAQHERLGIRPVPRLLDMAGLARMTSGPEDEPRWHQIERNAAEVQIRPTDPPAQSLPRWMAWAVVAMWLIALGMYLPAQFLREPLLERGALILAVYAAMFSGLWLLAVLTRRRGYTYTLAPEGLVIVTQYSMWRSRIVIKRNTIEAIRLLRIPDKGFRIEVVRKSGKPKVIPGGWLDAAWELAAILRKELGVPATTSEEDALGTGQMDETHPPGQTAPVPKEVPAPAKHYVQVRQEQDAIIIDKPALGPSWGLRIYVLVGVALMVGGFITASVVSPGMADLEGRKVTLFLSVAMAILGLVVMASAIGEMIEHYRFEITKTHLAMQRVLPWGTRNERWELGQVAEVRIEGASLLVLEDWTGKAHRLVLWGHTPSIRYTAALLRKHLAEMRKD